MWYWFVQSLFGHSTLLVWGCFSALCVSIWGGDGRSLLPCHSSVLALQSGIRRRGQVLALMLAPYRTLGK